MDALLVFCDLGHTLVSMQYDFPLRRVAREMLYSVHLMFRLRSFVKRKSFKNIILSVFVAFYHKSHTVGVSPVSSKKRRLKFEAFPYPQARRIDATL